MENKETLSKRIEDIPKLRFPGFEEKWKEILLSEIADKVVDKNNNLQYKEIFTNSAEYGVVSQKDFFVNDIITPVNLNKYYIVKENDFVYNPRISNSAPVGPININKLNKIGIMSPLYLIFHTHDIDTIYLENFFKSNHWHSYMLFNGNSGARLDRFSIKDSVFFDMQIFVPSYLEQQKIGTFLSKVDSLIRLYEKKLILFNKYKRGLILQNFNYIKENYSFVKLEEICKIIKSGGTPKSNVEEYYNGNIKFLSISDMTKAGQYIYNTEKHISDEGIKNSTAWLVKKGTVVLSMYASYGKSAILMDDMATSQAIIALVLKDNYNPHFLHYMLNYFNILKIWDFFICEGTQKNLNAQIVKNINVFIPPITVQNQIAQTLSSFDCLIEKEEQVLSQLKKYKQGLLQQMFI